MDQKGLPEREFRSRFNEIHENLGEMTEGEFRTGIQELFDELAPGGTDNHSTFAIRGMDSALPRWSKVLEIAHLSSSKDELGIADYQIGLNELNSLNPILTQALVGPGVRLIQILQSMLYLGPLRTVPERAHYVPHTTTRSRWATGLAAWDALSESDQDLVTETNNWLSREDRLNTGYGVMCKTFIELEKNSPLYLSIQRNSVADEFEDPCLELAKYPLHRRLALVDVNKGFELQPQDVGVGISQVLPVVVAALQKTQRTVLLEQPELHVHPAIQVALGDLFIESVRSGPKSFLIETHSEHLLLRILRRIREAEVTATGKIDPQCFISIVYLEHSDGQITCHRIRVDYDGEFVDEWPKGFFEERYQELFKK